MKQFLIYFSSFSFLLSFNINDATSDDWDTLSNYLSNDKINMIKTYIDLNGEISTIYELTEIDGINIVDIHNLKLYISVEPSNQNLSFSRRSSYQYE